MYEFARMGLHSFEIRIKKDVLTDGDSVIVSDVVAIGNIYVSGCIEYLEYETRYNQPMSDEEEETVEAEFREFMKLPENRFGQPVWIDEDSYRSGSLTKAFDDLIRGYYRIKHFSEDAVEKLCTKCLDWLHSTDFYTAPASTKYHDDYEGGLLEHSIRVYNKMIELLEVETFADNLSIMNDSVFDALLCALVHDWCKIGLYEKYLKNVKNDSTGQWEKVEAFRHKDSAIPLGHGTTSMFMAQKFFRLSIEQAAAIRWHMGVYQVSETEKPDLFRANESMPMNFLLQFADQLSITKY